MSRPTGGSFLEARRDLSLPSGDGDEGTSSGLTEHLEALAGSLRQDGRTRNEDAFLVRKGPPLVVALADGAGNAEQAARHALRLLERSLDAASEEDLRSFPNWSGWFRAIDAAMLGGAQTTLIALAVGEGRVLGAAAGDSRVYLWTRQGELSILNEAAAKFRVGSGSVVPFPIHVPFERGDALLLLSDGAWTPLSLSRLQGIVARVALAPLAELPQVVLREASRSGRADDMTVVAVRQR